MKSIVGVYDTPQETIAAIEGLSQKAMILMTFLL